MENLSGNRNRKSRNKRNSNTTANPKRPGSAPSYYVADYMISVATHLYASFPDTNSSTYNIL